jgi:predicted nucleic acid-binding protein
MIISPVHFSEINAIDDEIEKTNLLSMIDRCKSDVVFDLIKIHARTEELIKKGFGIGDAAHLAFAENSSDIFISCDNKLLKRALKNDIEIKVLSPVQFCLLEDLK